jgi:hypothetical protein
LQAWITTTGPRHCTFLRFYCVLGAQLRASDKGELVTEPPGSGPVLRPLVESSIAQSLPVSQARHPVLSVASSSWRGRTGSFWRKSEETEILHAITYPLTHSRRGCIIKLCLRGKGVPVPSSFCLCGTLAMYFETLRNDGRKPVVTAGQGDSSSNSDHRGE